MIIGLNLSMMGTLFLMIGFKFVEETDLVGTGEVENHRSGPSEIPKTS